MLSHKMLYVIQSGSLDLCVEHVWCLFYHSLRIYIASPQQINQMCFLNVSNIAEACTVT